MVRRQADLTLILHQESEHAAAALKKQGLRLFVRPEDSIPYLPEEITSLDDDELMNLFMGLTAWCDYISVQVSCAQIDERAAQRVLDYAESTAMIAGWGGTSAERVAVAKARMTTDPSVVALREDLDTKHAYRKLVETLALNIERDAALVSRELTRRTAGISSTPTRRSTRWQS